MPIFDPAGALLLDPVGGGGRELTAPLPPTPQLFLPRFTRFARTSSLRSEGLPRFLLISVLMPVQRCQQFANDISAETPDN